MLKTAPKPKESQGLSRIFSLVAELNALKKELETVISSKTQELNATIAAAKKIAKGDTGASGKDGRELDHNKIAELAAEIVLERMPQPKDGKDADKKEIVKELQGLFPSAEEISKYIPKPEYEKAISVKDVIAELKKEKMLSIEHIHGLDDAMKTLARQTAGGAYLHGGGDTVAAGSNVTITNVNGRKVISASSGSGTFYTDALVGTINGVNTAFTVANTITSALALFLAGIPYQVGIDYAVSGTTVTFSVAPDISLSGQPAWLLHT